MSAKLFSSFQLQKFSWTLQEDAGLNKHRQLWNFIHNNWVYWEKLVIK